MSLTYEEARSRSALIHDVHTVVHLDFTDTQHAIVEATINFACREPGATTFLELAGARSVATRPAGDLQCAVQAAAGRIELSNLAGPGERNEITVSSVVDYVSDGDGITSVIDSADGERYVCTYTAMDIAQRVLPCFDQPDIKSTFKVSVQAPEGSSVLANGLLEQAGDATQPWVFQSTPPIASYLFFVAAGPWVSRTWNHPYAAAPGGHLPCGWHARASQAAALDREFEWLRDLTVAAFEFYTETFDEPYPFADYQQVFSPSLNWGAMEFPGVVSFRDEYLTPGEPTAIQRQALAAVVCHEMAHMWFGDLVTMRWWEDTWLNESFADFMGYRVSGLTGYSTGWTMATLVRKPTAYRADARRSTHPIAEAPENLVDVDTAFANFDMITYAKGNAVLHQLVTWLGPEDFFAGVNAHLSAHPFGNATLADFLDALDGATDRDVRAWAESWLRTTGYDTIELTSATGVPTLIRHGSRPHRFTVSGFDEHGALKQQKLVDVGAEPVLLPEFAGLAVFPNSENEGYAFMRLGESDWRTLIESASRWDSALHRATLWATAAARVRAGLDQVPQLVADAVQLLARESDATVFEGALGLVHDLVLSHAHPDQMAELVEQLASLAREVTATGPHSHQGAAARLLAHTSSNTDMLLSWLRADSGLLADDQQLRWDLVTRLAQLGRPEVIAAEEQRDASTAGRHAARRSRAAVGTRQAKAEAWNDVIGGELSNREFAAAVAGFWGAEQTELLREWVLRAPAELADLARRSGQGMGQLIGRALPLLPLNTALLQDLVAEIERVLAHDEVPTVAARQFNDRLDDLREVLQGRLG